MLPGWMIFAAAFGYLLLLFAVASYGDRMARKGRMKAHPSRPMIYGLSLAIYCTSWTYFGSVGLAAERGLEFTGIYIGPILVFTLGMPLIRRIITLAKSEKITSVADFIGARYGKSPIVAALVAMISLVGAIPYIALQLKAVSSSVNVLIRTADYGIGNGNLYFMDLPLLVSLFLAFFAVIFGTRHADATEHQDGLILAIAMESVVKLLAFGSVGIYVVFVLFSGPEALWTAAQQNEQVMSALTYQTPVSRWILLVLLSGFAIIMLPRQFHVTVVENRTAGDLKAAGILLPLYLVAINIFVLPIAIGGIITFGGEGVADLYVLNLPIHGGSPILTMIAFLGGFSAATAMVIVASVALSIMVSNDIVMPVFLRQSLIGRGEKAQDFSRTLLRIRRTAIFMVLLLAYGYYRSTDNTAGLSSIGLLAFAAIAQMAPAMFGGLIWRRANARGAIAGMTSGFLVWTYLLFIPSLGGPDNSALATSILHFLFPFADIFNGQNTDPLVHSVIFSLLLNILAFVTGSLSRNARPVERIQAHVFIQRTARTPHVSRGWKTRVTVGELKTTIARYLGQQRTDRSFLTHERMTGRSLHDDQIADMGMVHFSEQLLGSAIGSASARLVLSLVLQRMEDASSDTTFLLDQASEALHYNQDMLQTALSQMDQGIAVFDTSNRLTIWNRRFRQLLDLPEHVGQVGFPLSGIIDILWERGDVKSADRDRIIANFMTLDTPFSLVLNSGNRIIEVRSNAMPDKGVVTTYTDVTQRVEADKALKQANETLEQRVEQRTGELTRVNRELAEARANAEEANIGKTRFFAAAGHDILQPLNAARLYSSALVERLGSSDDSKLVNNIDSSLESVEAILGAVLDISRLDTGAMKPRFSTLDLGDFLKKIETDFAPIARERGLRLTIVPSSLSVRSDPNLLRRLIQNLVSNAIKYTPQGHVLVGVRRRGDHAAICVLDTGIGIPSAKFRTVFKEFARLDEGMKTASGLGLGLSIVDRIAQVLQHRVELASKPGTGTQFAVTVPIMTVALSAATGRGEPLTGPAEISPLCGLTVLCIDNEPSIVDGMRILLAGWGCDVLTATTVTDAEAVVTMRTSPPDVIIADYHLDKANGIDAILLLRQQCGIALPALLLTADRTLDVRMLAERNDITVQNKPVKPATLRVFLTRHARA